MHRWFTIADRNVFRFICISIFVFTTTILYVLSEFRYSVLTRVGSDVQNLGFRDLAAVKSGYSGLMLWPLKAQSKI